MEPSAESSDGDQPYLEPEDESLAFLEGGKAEPEKAKRNRRRSISEIGAKIRKGFGSSSAQAQNPSDPAAAGDAGSTETSVVQESPMKAGGGSEEVGVSDGENLDSNERRNSIKGGKKSVAQTFKQMLIPQIDDEKLRQLFKHLPENESLIDDFSCALQRDILVHGRLYITQSYFSFHSNIFGWETVLSIPTRDIVSIRKEKTALVFPNAVMIATATAKYTFASFMTRDRAFTCMYHVWQNSLLEHPLSPAEMRAEAARDWRLSIPKPVVGSVENLSSSSAPLTPNGLGDASQPQFPLSPQQQSQSQSQNQGQSRHASSSRSSSSLSLSLLNGELPDAASDTRATPTVLAANLNQAADAASNSGSNGGSNGGNGTPSNTSSAAQRASGGASASPPSPQPPSAQQPSDLPAPSATQPLDCGCEDHYGRHYIDSIYNCGPEFLFRTLFSYSQYFTEIYENRNTTDVTMSEWKHLPDGSQDRELSYVLALNYSIGPKSTRAYEKQVLMNTWEPNKKYIVEAEVGTPHVPYGDNFYTTSRYCITRHGDRQTRLQVRSLVRYRKGQPWAITRTLIEKNSYEGLAKYWKLISDHMYDYIKRVEDKELYLEVTPKAATIPDTATSPHHESVPPVDPLVPSAPMEGAGFRRRRHSRQQSITSMASIHAERMEPEKTPGVISAAPSTHSPAPPPPSGSSFNLTKIQMWVIIALIAILLITNVATVIRLSSLEDKLLDLLAK